LDLKRIGIGIAVVIALVIVALALFGSKSLDTDNLESDLAAQADAEEVSCPDDVEVEAGKVFDCDATIDGQAQTIEVELTDDDGTYVARLK